MSQCLIGIYKNFHHYKQSQQKNNDNSCFLYTLLCIGKCQCHPEIFLGQILESTWTLLLWLWLLPVPVPVLVLQLLLQPVFQTQLILRQPVQVRPRGPAGAGRGRCQASQVRGAVGSSAQHPARTLIWGCAARATRGGSRSNTAQAGHVCQPVGGAQL